MRKAVLATVALLAVAPFAVQAQTMPVQEPSVWGSKVRITPFVGLAPTVNRTERWTVLAGSATFGGEFDVDLAAGPAVGANVEVRVHENIGLQASGIFITRGRTREFSLADAQFFEYNGSNFLIGKLAAALRVRESVSEMQLRQLSATLFAGPAFVREMPKDDISLHPAQLDGINHWGVNFGFNAELPLAGGRASIQGGLEDVYVWWNSDEIARRNDIAFADEGFPNTVSFLDAEGSHMLLLRLGLALHVQ